MSEYIVELDSKHSIALKLAFAEEMRGGDFVRGEIVRCRDCLSWFRGECHKHVFTITVDGTEYDEGVFPMDAGDFCSLGTPRTDAHAERLRGEGKTK